MFSIKEYILHFIVWINPSFDTKFSTHGMQVAYPIWNFWVFYKIFSEFSPHFFAYYKVGQTKS